MKLLKFPLLVIGIVLKHCDDRSILDMCLDYLRMRRLIISFRQVPRDFKVNVDFNACQLEIVPFRKYAVVKYMLALSGSQEVNENGTVSVYVNENTKGLMEVVMDIITKLELKKLENLTITCDSPIREILRKSTEIQLTVGRLTLRGRGPAGVETRQIFSLPFLEKITRCVCSMAHPDVDFELPVFPVPINVPEVRLTHSRWFTIQHLMKFEKVRLVVLTGSVISSVDIRRFLVKWMNKEYEDLVRLHIATASAHRLLLEWIVTGIINPNNVQRVGLKSQVVLQRDDGARAALEVHYLAFTCQITKPLST